MEILEDLPAGIFIDLAIVVVTFGGNFHSSGEALDLPIEMCGVHELVTRLEAVALRGHGIRKGAPILLTIKSLPPSRPRIRSETQGREELLRKDDEK